MLSSRGSTNPLRAAAKKGDAAAPQRPRVQDLFPSGNGKMGMKLNDRSTTHDQKKKKEKHHSYY